MAKQEVTAPVDGSIVQADMVKTEQGVEAQVSLVDNEGYTHIFLHLTPDSFDAAKIGPVVRGQVIGYVDDANTHLHTEVM